MSHRTRRRSTSRRRIDNPIATGTTYCGYIDGMGYCCTTPMLPGKLLCETHMEIAMSGPLQREPSYMHNIGGIGTNPMTAQAAEAAIINLQKTPTPATYIGGAPNAPAPSQLQMPTPKVQPTKLKDQLDASPFFKDIATIFGDTDWITVLNASPQSILGNRQSKKLADYIFPKMGIDVNDALGAVSNDENIRIIAAAGVNPRSLLAELMARESIWDQVPYIRYLLEQKYPPATAPQEYGRGKRVLVDALTEYTTQEPKLFGKGYGELYSEIFNKLKNTQKIANLLVRVVQRDVIPKLNDKQITADILRNLICKISNLPEPDITVPDDAIRRMVKNFREIDTRYKCAERGLSTVSERCWEWVDKQTSTILVTVDDTLAGFVARAKTLLPSFVAIFK